MRYTAHAFVVCAFAIDAIAASIVDANHAAVTGIMRYASHAFTLLALAPYAIAAGANAEHSIADSAHIQFRSGAGCANADIAAGVNGYATG